MTSETLKRTPLYSNHLKLKARMVPFAGYEMPVQYQGLLDEAKACRKAVGMFDVSHMGQFSVHGEKALGEVQKLVTNDLSKLQIGQAQYNMLCNEHGGVIDDLVIYRRADNHIYICVNASNRTVDFSWMKEKLPSSVTLEDESDSTSLIAIQGPKAESVLSTLTETLDIKTLKYYWAHNGKVAGIDCYISRTGYTGEDGFELYLSNSKASQIWDTLIQEGTPFGLTPCGLGARDTLRMEMGYPLHGHELSPEVTPLQAGLSWTVKLQKPTPFIGQEALKKELAETPKRVLRGYRILDRRIARQGYPVLSKEGEKVGVISSGTLSPHLECPIALAFIDRKWAEEEVLWAEVRGQKIEMSKSKIPFIQPHTKKV